MATNKKKPATKSATNKKHTQKKKTDTGMQYEFLSLFIIVGGLLLGVFLYAPSGILGEWIKMLFWGMLGLPSCLLPFLVLAFGIHRVILSNREIFIYMEILPQNG